MAESIEKSGKSKPKDQAIAPETPIPTKPKDQATPGETTTNIKPKKRRFDWEAIEKEFRAGALSIREIGRQYGPSDMAIRKRAKKHGWKRDLSEEVRRRVRAEAVRTVRTKEEQAEFEEEAIDQAVARGVAVVRSHQKLLTRGINVIKNMLTALEAPDKFTYKNMFGKDITGMYPSHVTAYLNSLSNALKTFIPLERQAHNLDEHGEPPEAKRSWTSFPNANEPLTLDEWEAQMVGRETNGKLNNSDID